MILLNPLSIASNLSGRDYSTQPYGGYIVRSLHVALDVLHEGATIVPGGGGGIGRRRGLKILCSRERVGSTPTRPIDDIGNDPWLTQHGSFAVISTLSNVELLDPIVPDGFLLKTK